MVSYFVIPTLSALDSVRISDMTTNLYSLGKCITFAGCSVSYHPNYAKREFLQLFTKCT